MKKYFLYILDIFFNYRNRVFECDVLDESKKVKNNLPKVLFFFTIFVYFLFLLRYSGDWLFSGEMWAEMATNYYPNSFSSWYNRLFAIDAGYIPFPQRIIASIGAILNIPAWFIPYFYTWSAALLLGASVSVFCLRSYRVVIDNDYLRCVVSIAVLMAIPWEMRIFINFTYMLSFFVGIITAAALLERQCEVPWYAWIIPFLVLSKPAMLSTLPIIFLAAFVSKKRFRYIAVFSILAGLLQLCRLLVSHYEGFFVFTKTFTLAEKVYAASKFFFIFLASYPPVFINDARISLYAGMFIFILIIFISIMLKRRAMSLVLIGMSFISMNSLLYCFTLSNGWNVETVYNIKYFFVSRNMGTIYVGMFFVCCGIIGMFPKELYKISIPKYVAPALFVVFFIVSGWYRYSAIITTTPHFPKIHGCQWQEVANDIESGKSYYLPINPIDAGSPWAIGRNFDKIKNDIKLGSYLDSPILSSNAYSYTKNIDLSCRVLAELGVAIKPLNQKSFFVECTALVHLKDGKTISLYGQKKITTDGALLILKTNASKNYANINIDSVVLQFNAPVSIAQSKENAGEPGILFIGK